MVKEFKYETTFSINLENFTKRISVNGEFKRMYQLARDDTDVTVSRWKNDAGEELAIGDFTIRALTVPFTRDTTFNTPLNAPAMVCKLLGTSILGSMEKETMILKSDREIETTSFLTFKAASLQDMAANPSKQVDDMVIVTMICSATETEYHYTNVCLNITIDLKKPIWGFVGLIESAIESFTKESLDKWVQMVDANCQEFQAELQEARQTPLRNADQQQLHAHQQQQMPQSPQPHHFQHKQFTPHSPLHSSNHVHFQQQQQHAMPSPPLTSPILHNEADYSTIINDNLIFAPDDEDQSLVSTASNSLKNSKDSQFFDARSNDSTNEQQQRYMGASSPIPAEKSPSVRFSLPKTPHSADSHNTTMSLQQQHQNDDDYDLRPINLSHLLTRSYNLAELKRQISDTRALVAKTEMRIRSVEQVYQDHQLEHIVNQYLQKVNNLYEAQQALFVEVKAKAEQLGKQLQTYYEAQNIRRMLMRTRVSYFFGGMAFGLVVVLPFVLYLYKRIYGRRRVNKVVAAAVTQTLQ